MNSWTVSVLLVMIGGICITIVREAFNSKAEKEKIEKENDGVNVEVEANDRELTGIVTITRQVRYPGLDEHDGGRAIVRYDSRDDDGVLRVSKWILWRGKAYYDPYGHFVLYQYFRANGALLSDRLVHPVPLLSAGVYTKTRLRFFDEQSKLIEEQYMREDGTLGVEIDLNGRRFQQFRRDGKTLRFVQFSETDNKFHKIWYRRDGQTRWFETGAEGLTDVYFDLRGNDVARHFTRNWYVGRYSMEPESTPRLTLHDHYLRPDGSLFYKQAWYTRWDDKADAAVDSLGAVIVFDRTGKKPVAEYTVALRSASAPRFIPKVIFHNEDGTSLIREYRSPGCRSSEDILDAEGEISEHKEFDLFDSYQEEIDEVFFDGFDRNLWGVYDDDSHDI